MAPDWFDKTTIAIGVIMLHVMLIVGIIQVLNRYVGLPFGLQWTYEVARTFLALMTIIAIPYLFKNDSDISFLPVLRRVTTRTDEILLGRNVLVGVLAVILVWSSYLAFQTSGQVGLPLLRWFKVGWGYLLIGVCAAILILFIVVDTRERVTRALGGGDV